MCSLCTLQSQGSERVNFGYTRFMTMQNFCYNASSYMGQFTAGFPANKTEPRIGRTFRQRLGKLFTSEVTSAVIT